VIASDVDRIVLMYGGNRTDKEYVSSLADQRLILEEEKDRLGKAESLNRSFRFAAGELTFILSGDIQIEEDIFKRCFDAMEDDIGVIIPRVVPEPVKGLHGKIGSALWKLHDTELEYMSKRNLNVHGGEFLAIRRKLLPILPRIVNDDAYICLNAKRLGYRVEYRDDIKVRNQIPGTLIDLLIQRIRVNFGHQELLRMNLDPLVMTTLIITDRKTFFSIMVSFLKRYRKEILILPLVCIVEALALILSRSHLKKGKSYYKWPISNKDIRL